MQGYHTYAYANSMPAKRDELDEWLAEALEERTDDEARSELERLRGDMQQAAAAAKGKPHANPPKKKGSAVGKAAKAGVMGAGLYQVVQAFKGLKGASEAAIQQVMSQLDPEMVATIADAAQSVGQAVGLEENLDPEEHTPMMPPKPVAPSARDLKLAVERVDELLNSGELPTGSWIEKSLRDIRSILTKSSAGAIEEGKFE